MILEEGPDSLSLVIAERLAAVRRDPTSGAAHLALAEAYRLRENWTAARASSRDALRWGLAKGDSARALGILADIALRQGRPNEARRHLRVLQEREAASPDILIRLAQFLWDDHFREEALLLAMEAIGRDAQDERKWRWTAQSWKEAGRLEEALHLWRKIEGRGWATDEDLFQIGFLSQRLGDGQGASDAYGHLLDRDPDHPQGNYNLSLLLLQAADTLGAAEHLERTIRGAPAIQAPYFDLALLYMRTKRYDDARRVLIRFREEARPDSVTDLEAQELLRVLSER